MHTRSLRFLVRQGEMSIGVLHAVTGERASRVKPLPARPTGTAFARTASAQQAPAQVRARRNRRWTRAFSKTRQPRDDADWVRPRTFAQFRRFRSDPQSVRQEPSLPHGGADRNVLIPKTI